MLTIFTVCNVPLRTETMSVMVLKWGLTLQQKLILPSGHKIGLVTVVRRICEYVVYMANKLNYKFRIDTLEATVATAVHVRYILYDITCGQCLTVDSKLLYTLEISVIT